MSVVYLVHCIDTEGPLDEGWPTTALRGRSYEPGHYDATAYAAGPWTEIARHRKRTLGSWDLIASMVRHVTAPKFRAQMTDSFGGSWIYNWFCMDHLGFVDNPRGRDMGMHRIFDFYSTLLNEQSFGDAIHWHFHSATTYAEANKCGMSYLNSPFLREIIARRLLDRKWFPVANRAGFQDERPDSHWFLEQWIPFDLSNTSTDDIDPIHNPDLVNWRFSDWRGAPIDWSTYHPDHDYHQLVGRCRRKVARCLNLLNRFGNLTKAELEKGFRRAADGVPTLVAFCSHDWRDFAPEVDYVRSLLNVVTPQFPEVRFKFAEAREAFNAVHPPIAQEPLMLACMLRSGSEGGKVLSVRTVKGRVFGPQPFLAVQTRSQRIINDNFGFGDDYREWRYVFDDHSVLPDDIRRIAIGANDDAGNQSIHLLDLSEPRQTSEILF